VILFGETEAGALPIGPFCYCYLSADRQRSCRRRGWRVTGESLRGNRFMQRHWCRCVRPGQYHIFHQGDQTLITYVYVSPRVSQASEFLFVSIKKKVQSSERKN